MTRLWRLSARPALLARLVSKGRVVTKDLRGLPALLVSGGCRVSPGRLGRRVRPVRRVRLVSVARRARRAIRVILARRVLLARMVSRHRSTTVLCVGLVAGTTRQLTRSLG
nr:MAG TPA: hypothetical protein [Caudoviricetes sp.]